nr:11514_t:CDS:2 [Entrophospora candida]
MPKVTWRFTKKLFFIFFSKISNWLRSGVIKQNIKSTLKATIDALHNACPLKEKNPSQPSRPYAVFKKWVYSPAFFGSKVINHYNTEQNNQKSPPPLVKHTFSFTDEEQGAFIEPIFNLVEKALNENEHMIPSTVAKIFASKHHINPDFDNADTQSHGTLIDQKGQWSDHKLQHIAILACNVVTCDNYKELHAIKEKLDNKIIQKWMDDN